VLRYDRKSGPAPRLRQSPADRGIIVAVAGRTPNIDVAPYRPDRF
jgi:hypothetical protein